MESGSLVCTSVSVCGGLGQLLAGLAAQPASQLVLTLMQIFGLNMCESTWVVWPPQTCPPVHPPWLTFDLRKRHSVCLLACFLSSCNGDM